MKKTEAKAVLEGLKRDIERNVENVDVSVFVKYELKMQIDALSIAINNL